jgi:hypothetical protein
MLAMAVDLSRSLGELWLARAAVGFGRLGSAKSPRS